MAATLIDLARSPRRRAVATRLRDGEVARLRPLRTGEAAPLLDVFAGMSEEAREMRYLVPLPRLTRPMTEVLTAVDGDRHVAWLATVSGRPAGIARTIRLDHDPAAAELAFEVVDRHQGRGLGAALTDAVTTVAYARGVRRLRATLRADNGVSIALLARLGMEMTQVDELLEGEGPLRLLDPARVDRHAVLTHSGAVRPAKPWTRAPLFAAH